MINKNNIWPIGLAVSLIILVAGSVLMVVFSKRVSSELVTDEYYQEGLTYQDQIDRINNTKKLDRSVLVQLMENNQILFFFPSSFPPQEIKGSIVFFRADDKNLDFSKPIQVDPNHRQIIDGSQLKNGNWKVKVFWNHGSSGFYNESLFVIQ